jgi:hypothetical protein
LGPFCIIFALDVNSFIQRKSLKQAQDLRDIKLKGIRFPLQTHSVVRDRQIMWKVLCVRQLSITVTKYQRGSAQKQERFTLAHGFSPWSLGPVAAQLIMQEYVAEEIIYVKGAGTKERDMKGLGSNVTFNGMPLMTQLPSIRPHLLKILPPHLRLGTKSSSRGPLGDISHPNHSMGQSNRLSWGQSLTCPVHPGQRRGAF